MGWCTTATWQAGLVAVVAACRIAVNLPSQSLHLQSLILHVLRGGGWGGSAVARHAEARSMQHKEGLKVWGMLSTLAWWWQHAASHASMAPQLRISSCLTCTAGAGCSPLLLHRKACHRCCHQGT
jgi:hypothetical protein